VESIDRVAPARHCGRLDLDRGPGSAKNNDQVDLAAPDLGIARNDAGATRGEKEGSDPLAECAEI